jgi:hypothetical protein
MFKAKMVKPSFGWSLRLNLHSILALPGVRLPKYSASYRSMSMTFATLGISTSPVEVTNISRHGFWLLLGDEELFLPFSEFPWFQEASVAKILNVELSSANHLYWPDLDIDLAVESIRHPERFPLVSQI